MHIQAALSCKKAEPYLQHDKTSKWDVLTYFVAMFPDSRSSDIDIGRQDGDAAMEGVVVF